MRGIMRTTISAMTVLGLVLLALALSGISGLAGELEAATAPRVPAPATEEPFHESREIDCPLERPEPQRL